MDIVPDEERGPDGYSSPITGAIVIPKENGAAKWGDITLETIQNWIDNDKFRNLPVLYEHDREWRIGRVMGAQIGEDKVTGELTAYAKAQLNLDDRKACFAWNQMMKGNTPCFSLSHRTGAMIPTELSIVCEPVREEGQIVSCSTLAAPEEYIKISGSASGVHQDGKDAKESSQTVVAYSLPKLMSEATGSTLGSPAVPPAAPVLQQQQQTSIVGHPANINPVAAALTAPASGAVAAAAAASQSLATPSLASAVSQAVAAKQDAAAAAADAAGGHVGSGSKRSFGESFQTPAPMSFDKTADNTAVDSGERHQKAMRSEHADSVITQLQRKIEQLERGKELEAQRLRSVVVAEVAEEYKKREAEQRWTDQMKQLDDEFALRRANNPQLADQFQAAYERFQRARPFMGRMSETDREPFLEEFRAGVRTIGLGAPQVPAGRRPAAAAAAAANEQMKDDLPSRADLAAAIRPTQRGYGATPRSAAAAAAAAGFDAPASASASFAHHNRPAPNVAGLNRGGGISVTDRTIHIPGADGLRVTVPDFVRSCSAGQKSILEMTEDERATMMAAVIWSQPDSVMQIAYKKSADKVSNELIGEQVVKDYERKFGVRLLNTGYTMSPSLA